MATLNGESVKEKGHPPVWAEAHRLPVERCGELDAQAQALRAEGLTYREVGERMGETTKKAWTRCNRERERANVRGYKARHRDALKEYNQRYHDEHRATCPRCGHTYAPGSGTKAGPAAKVDFSNCSGCAREKREQIEKLWLDGCSMKDIARELGVSRGHVGVEMARMREAGGYDLPYRHVSAEPRHPEQVPA